LLLLGYKKSNSDQKLYNKKTIKFNCKNVEKKNFYHICEIINKSIILSEGFKRNLFGINYRRYYFIHPFINDLNFVKEANTCDILLFKCFSSGSKCCRTNSNYEHISLLVKNKNNLQIYDYTEENGSRLRNYIEFIYLMHHLHYEKIVYRKLNISIKNMINYIHELNIDEYENNDNYILNNISLNEIKNKFYKIINEKVELFMHNNNDIKNKDSSLYFSSELIAMVYMFCNIIKKKNDLYNYLPEDFSEKSKINFINGFSLGPETIIDFSE
jgi:hypothetical protein